MSPVDLSYLFVAVSLCLLLWFKSNVYRKEVMELFYNKSEDI